MPLLLRWVSATVVGLAVGGFMFHFAGTFGGPAWNPFAVVFGGMIGFANGVVVGAIQWAALGLSRRQGARLLLAMALAVGVTHGLHDGAPTSIRFVTVATASGLAVAVIFGILFDHRGAAALLAGFAGWAGGLLLAGWLTFSVLVLPRSEAPFDAMVQHTVLGIVVAIGWGVPTALTGLPTAILGRQSRTIEAGGLAAQPR